MMTALIKRFVRRPFYVDGVQVTAENIAEVAEWCGGDVRDALVSELGETNKYVKVRVYRPLNERQTKAFVGDWILYAGTGFKVYTSKAFEKSFQAAENTIAVNQAPLGDQLFLSPSAELI